MKTTIYATCHYTGQTRKEVFETRELADKFLQEMKWSDKIQVEIYEHDAEIGEIGIIDSAEKQK